MQSREGMLEQMETYAVRAKAIIPLCDNEEQTKISLINPYLELLGYDVRDPRHVQVEVRADIHEGREKVDYAVLRDGAPWMVVEAKAATTRLEDGKPTKQVVRYAMAAPVQYAALTNGRTWRWFRKANGGAMLEDSPFLVHDVLEPSAREIRWLAGIHQSRWQSEAVARIADEESLQSRFEAWFDAAAKEPPEKLLAMLLNEVGHRATAPMMARARTAWIETVRSRENGILTRASRRLQEGETAEAGREPTADEADRKPRKISRRWWYRIREGGPEAAWTYFWNGKNTMMAVAAIAARRLSVEELGRLWETKLLRKEELEVEAWYRQVEGTSHYVFTQIDGPTQRAWMAKVMGRIPGLEVETEKAQRDESQDLEQHPWTSIQKDGMT